MCKGRWQNILPAVALLALLFLGWAGTWGLLHAADVSGALFTLTARWTNSGASDLVDLRANFPISGAALIDQNLIEADALNAALQKGGVDVPGMPPMTRILVEGMVAQDGSAFTEFTTEAQSSTANDVPLLPTAPAVDDAVYFGCDNPCRIVTWDTDTAGVNVLTLTWEFWDGDSYEVFTGVTDNTNTFTGIGRGTVSWDMPSTWATSTVTGSSVTSYWGRGRVSAFTSQTTQPLATRVFYENGEWWTWLEALEIDTQEQYTLSFGGTDMITAHQLFPGAAGVLTADNVTLEVTGSYATAVRGRFNFANASATSCIVCKTSVVTVNISGTATSPAIGLQFTAGGGTTTLDLRGLTVPDTGEQTVIWASDGTDLVLLANAGGGLESGPAQGGTNNGNTWTWASKDGIDYLEWVRLRTSAPTVMDSDRTFARWDTGTHTNTQAYSGALGLDNE